MFLNSPLQLGIQIRMVFVQGYGSLFEPLGILETTRVD